MSNKSLQSLMNRLEEFSPMRRNVDPRGRRYTLRDTRGVETEVRLSLGYNFPEITYELSPEFAETVRKNREGS